MNLLLQNDKLKEEIKQQIRKSTRLWEDLETPEEVLYRELTKNLVVIKYEKTKKWMVASEFCDKDIRENLESNWLEYDLDAV